MSDVVTLHELATGRRSEDRPTHVHVVGDLDQDPPKGIATAKRVAALLADGDGTVHENNFGERLRADEVAAGDVALVTIEEAPLVAGSQAYKDLRHLAVASSILFIGGIVVFTEAVPGDLKQYLNARVWARSGDVDRVEHFEHSPYERAVYVTELEGLR